MVNLNKPAFQIFPEAKSQIKQKKCPTCGNEIGKFRDVLSEKEYHISGMCQKCQDLIFGF